MQSEPAAAAVAKPALPAKAPGSAEASKRLGGLKTSSRAALAEIRTIKDWKLRKCADAELAGATMPLVDMRFLNWLVSEGGTDPKVGELAWLRSPVFDGLREHFNEYRDHHVANVNKAMDQVERHAVLGIVLPVELELPDPELFKEKQNKLTFRGGKLTAWIAVASRKDGRVLCVFDVTATSSAKVTAGGDFNDFYSAFTTDLAKNFVVATKKRVTKVSKVLAIAEPR